MDQQPEFRAPSASERLELIAQLRSAVASVMNVSGYRFADNGQLVLSGTFNQPLDKVYKPLRAAAESAGYTPWLRDGENGKYDVFLTPGVIPKQKINYRTPLILFLVTVASVVFSPSGFGSPEGTFISHLLDGLMFAGSLLGILVVHEFGHYLVAKYRGAPVSLPYFLPLPILGGVGTLGAVIVQREPFENRRHLLEIGIAGPLAGFIVAVPLMFVGYLLSHVGLVPDGAMTFGDSLLTRLFSIITFGQAYPANGMDIYLHPIGFGAWFGLFITGINLLPVGQLDGGHVAYAILGENAKYLGYAVIAVMLILAITVSQGWLLWVALLLLFGRSHPPLLNQAAKLEPLHYALAIAGLLVFILTFVPMPM
ncbi:MAG TPA: site-2 protease family protein [Thermoflexales bacterium]|nr:site-2 protease family protein [Thermoflexales bacterium]